MSKDCLSSRWWRDGHRNLLDLIFHTGVMTEQQVAALFFSNRSNPSRSARRSLRRLYRNHLLDFTADASDVLIDLSLTPARAACLGRVGLWLVANQNGMDYGDLSYRSWNSLRPTYLAHNLMLAELVKRTLISHPGLEFSGEYSVSVGEQRKVTTRSGKARKRFRYLLKPDGLFRYPDGTVYLVEIERARPYDFGRILDKVKRYNNVCQNNRRLWARQWKVRAFPPVLVLALSPERHMERLCEEVGDRSNVEFLFLAWDDFLRNRDPLAGWSTWGGQVVDLETRRT